LHNQVVKIVIPYCAGFLFTVQGHKRPFKDVMIRIDKAFKRYNRCSRLLGNDVLTFPGNVNKEKIKLKIGTEVQG
jgi:hypothetical protein